MNIQTLLDQLKDSSNEATQINAVQELKSVLEKDCVLETLCRTAVGPVGAKVREAILAALQPTAEKANGWFVAAARDARHAARRRLALLNLSLMECRSAESREVILQGLKDPDEAIQHAAALCAGFFDDTQFLTEVERFLERNRFVLACAGVQRMIFRAPPKPPDRSLKRVNAFHDRRGEAA